jgi:hypothetical protein
MTRWVRQVAGKGMTSANKTGKNIRRKEVKIILKGILRKQDVTV